MFIPSRNPGRCQQQREHHVNLHSNPNGRTTGFDALWYESEAEICAQIQRWMSDL